MNELLEITDKLQDTQAAIVQLENALAYKGSTPSILASLKSLQRRQSSLERQLEEIALQQQLDICSYRLFDPESHTRKPSLKAFAKTLLDFQNLFTQVYAAIKARRPKNSASISVEVSQETSLNFAYTFTGSLGVVLTLPNDRVLFGETNIDETQRLISTLMKADNPQVIARYARDIGLAPIRTLYKWASDQVEAGLSAEIQWKRGDEVKFEAISQVQELERLKSVIEASSEEQTETFDFEGLLVGIDTTSRTFHMTFAEHGEIRGKIDPSIGVDVPVQVPRRYKARVIVSRTISYATEQETVVYFLKELR